MQQVLNKDIFTCPTQPLLHRRHHHRTGADPLRCPRWTDLENRLQIAAWPPSSRIVRSGSGATPGASTNCSLSQRTHIFPSFERTKARQGRSSQWYSPPCSSPLLLRTRPAKKHSSVLVRARTLSVEQTPPPFYAHPPTHSLAMYPCLLPFHLAQRRQLWTSQLILSGDPWIFLYPLARYPPAVLVLGPSNRLSWNPLQ